MTPDIRVALIAEVERLAAPLPVFDLTEYVSIDDLPMNDVGEALLIDFVTSSETMSSIGGFGNQGWEQVGSSVIHWLYPAGDPSYPILVKGEALRNELKGRRLPGTPKAMVTSAEPFLSLGEPVNGGWASVVSNIFIVSNSCG